MTAATPGQAALPPLPPKWTGKFRKRPVVVEAAQLVDDLRNHTEAAAWIEGSGGHAEIPFAEPCLYIETLEGRMRADIGDWIIKGVKGEFYPCKPDIFEATYAPAVAAQAARLAPELHHTATIGIADDCLTPGAVYATHIGTAGLSVTVDYGRELPIGEDEAAALDSALHDALETELAPHFGTVPAEVTAQGPSCTVCEQVGGPHGVPWPDPKPAPELAAAVKAAVVAEIREAASCESDDGDECRKCNRHADAILAAVAAPEVAAAKPDLRTAWRLADERLALLGEILSHPGIGHVPAALRAKWRNRAGLPS